MNKLFDFAISQRILMVLLAGLLCLVGAVAFMRLNIEAYPDPVPPMVNVITQAPGLSSEEIERYITIPIESVTSGLQNLKLIRTTSVFGLSDIKLQFTYDVTYEVALQRVLNQLALLPALPNGAQPQISPLSPIGEIYRYRLTGPPDYSVTDLTTLQNWVLQRRFRSIPGVVDAIGWGGKSKAYEVTVDFNKLLAYGLTMPQLMTALQNANQNVGGNTVTLGAQSGVIRGVGLISSIDDIADTFVATVGQTPVRVRDIATVTIGHRPRLGIAGQGNDDDIVQGIVLMRRGEQSRPTIERVQAEVQRINAGGVLPPGVRIERIYDRKELIDITTATVVHSASFGIALIFIVQWLFLGNFRSAVIVAATIPFALSFAVTLMVLRGESANLLSVGAVDFGLIVDAAVIMTENIFRLLAERSHHKEQHGLVEDGPADLRGRIATILQASGQVGTAIIFSCLIIVTSFLPLFTMQGVEGHIFSPMAKTYAYALSGGLICAFFVTPALATFLLRGPLSEKETFIVRGLRALYEPMLARAVAHRRVTIVLAAGLLAISMLAGRTLGLEFLPKLEEGNLWIRATLNPTISLEEGNIYANRIRRVIASYAEVETVVSQQGRTDDGTEVAGFNNIEFFTPLKPREQWRPGIDKNKLIDMMLAELQRDFPGVDFNFSQYLEDNVSEAASGVKGENAIKLFGNNLQAATEQAERVRKVLATVRGIDDLAVFTVLGQPTLTIQIDRLAAGRYNLSPGDINTAIRTAIGGDSPGDFFEPGSDRRFPIIVRLGREFRESRKPSEPAHRRGGQHRQHDADPAAGGRDRVAGLRCGGHLSRAAAALHSHPVQRPGSGSRLDHPGGPGEDRRRNHPAGRHAHGMGRGVRESPAGHRPPSARRANHAAADRFPPVRQFQLHRRHAAGPVRGASGHGRRDLLAGADRHALRRLRCHRIHCADRRLGHGGDHRHLLFQRARRSGPRPRRGRHRMRAGAHAARDDDLCRGLRRPSAGGAQHRHRQPGPAPARLCGGRRHSGGALPDPGHPAGLDRAGLQASARAGRCSDMTAIQVATCRFDIRGMRTFKLPCPRSRA